MSDDPRHPHLSSNYTHGRRVPMTAPRADVALAPVQLMNTSSATANASAAVEVEHSMLPGKALEEMTVAELRDRASERGIAYRGLNKAALVKALRA